MASNETSEEAQFRACKDYCQTHNIQKLIKDAIMQLCIHKPEQPVSFLKEHFAQLESNFVSDTQERVRKFCFKN